VAARAALSDACSAQGDLEGAAQALEAVLASKPDWVEARYNYGCALKKQMKLDRAEEELRRVIALDPKYVGAYRMLGSVLLGQSRIEEALRVYGEGRRHGAASFDLESAELFALNASDGVSSEELFSRHAAFGARLESAHPARFAPFRNAADPNRRLRVGYVSGDFCYHVVTLFLLPLIERRDRSAFEVYCYSTGGRTDEFSRRLSARADVWRDAAALSDTELAERIHKDGIDLLVDLAGHSGVPKLGVFAQRPAPVQATWLGYLNTTGMTRIRYRISDSYSDPPGLADRHHTERLVRLPHSQWCYRPFLTIDHAAAPPVVRNGHVTFGSFNQAVKLSPSTRRLWAEVLVRLPDARLVVLGVNPGRAQEDLHADLERAGVARDRIRVLPYVSLEDYFRWYNEVDIALDTTPYSGGTTTCDALWMGVPVVTVPGERSSSRSAASILTTVGLADWIGATREDYVGLAVRFAGERDILAGLRRTLRSRMRASPLMDEAGFARDMEAAYRSMWRLWCESGDRR
jgi:predicted O-linked N-acetylglucosamine transferase (SPINDLY family)